MSVSQGWFSGVVGVGLVVVLVLPLTAGCSAKAPDVNPEAALASSSSFVPSRLASGEGKRATSGEALARLSFSPTIPKDVAGREPLGYYTYADPDDTPEARDLRGKDNLLEVLYADSVLLTERQWDPAVVRDEQAYGRGLVSGVPRASEYIRRHHIQWPHLWLTDAVTLPESTGEDGEFLPGVHIELSSVSWFSGGVVYIISSPSLAVEELLPTAQEMIE